MKVYEDPPIIKYDHNIMTDHIIKYLIIEY